MKKYIYMVILICLASFSYAYFYTFEGILTREDGSAKQGFFNATNLSCKNSSDEIFFSELINLTSDRNGKFYTNLNLPATYNETNISCRWIIDGEDSGWQRQGFVKNAENAQYLQGKDLSYFASSTNLDNSTIARTNKDNDFGLFDLFGNSLGSIPNWWNNLFVKNATIGNATLMNFFYDSSGNKYSLAELNQTPTLDQILNPVADKIFTLGGHTLDWRFTNPIGGVRYLWEGGASGHLFELMEDSLGNTPPGTYLLHVEANDIDTISGHFIHNNDAGTALMVDNGIVNFTMADDIIGIDYNEIDGTPDLSSYQTMADAAINLSTLNQSQFTYSEGTYLKIAGASSDYVPYSGATTNVNLGEKTLTTTSNITGGKLQIDNVNIDASIDHEIYDSSDNLIIQNLNSDKDIIFSVNDGGTQKSFLTIDSSFPSLILNADNYSGGPTDGVFKISFSSIGAGVGAGMTFEGTPANAGGQLYIANGIIKPPLTDIGVSAQGYVLTSNANTGVTTANIGHTLFKGSINSYETGATAGIHNKKGFDFSGGSVTWFPSSANSASFSVRGSSLSAPSITHTDLGGFSSTETFEKTGIYLSGWGQESIIGGSGFSDVIKRAMYSDGGDWIFDHDSDSGKFKLGDDQEVEIGFDGTNLIVNMTNDGALTIYNSTGLGKIRALEYATSTPKDLSYSTSDKYINNLPNPENLLDENGKIKGGVFKMAQATYKETDYDRPIYTEVREEQDIKYFSQEEINKIKSLKSSKIFIEGDNVISIIQKVSYPYKKEVNVTLIDTQAFENTMMISELKQENQMLKDELCTHDTHFTWCNGVEPK